MEIERKHIETPGAALQDPYDCIWVIFRKRKSPSPLMSRTLEWLDWELGGVLSRYLIEDKSKQVTTYISNLRKLPVRYLVLEACEQPDMNAFLKNCQSLKFTRVLCVCEATIESEIIEKKLRKHETAFPLHVTVASERGA